MVISSFLNIFSIRPCELQRPSSQAVQNAEMGTHSPVRGACPFAPFSFRFPLLGWRRTDPNELIVGQPLTSNSVYYGLKPSSIIVFTAIKTEGLLIKIANQMEPAQY